MHFDPGYIIGPVVLAVFIAIPFLRLYFWKKRWDVGRYGTFGGFPGILVRFEGASFTPAMARTLDSGIREIVACIRERWPERTDLLEWRVIVRRVGAVGMLRGELLGGTWKVERMFPTTKKIYVAIVVEEMVAHFIAHEVSRHILPMLVEGIRDDAIVNGDHTLARYAAVQADMKARIDRRLTAEV